MCAADRDTKVIFEGLRSSEMGITLRLERMYGCIAYYTWSTLYMALSSVTRRCPSYSSHNHEHISHQHSIQDQKYAFPFYTPMSVCHEQPRKKKKEPALSHQRKSETAATPCIGMFCFFSHASSFFILILSLAWGGVSVLYCLFLLGIRLRKMDRATFASLSERFPCIC